MARRPPPPATPQTGGAPHSSPERDRYVAGLKALGPRSMTAGQIDGLLAAVLTSPDYVEAEAWLAAVWVGDGEAEEEEADEVDLGIDPASPEVLEAVASILGRREAIVEEFDLGQYEPIFDVGPDGQAAWETWIDGFSVGMALAPEAWHDLLDASARTEVREAARIMATLATIADDGPVAEEALGRRVVAELRSNACDLIAECVLVLAMADAPPQAPIVRGPKIGRNDPCPCGSGKKYKKCCAGA